MKTIIRIFFFVLFPVLFCIDAFGEEKGVTNNGVEKLLVPKKEDNSDKRPRMPGVAYLTCWLFPTQLTVEVPEGVEYVDVELSSGNVVVWTTTVTEDENSACLPGLYGEYILTCTTDGNHTYVAAVDLR